MCTTRRTTPPGGILFGDENTDGDGELIPGHNFDLWAAMPGQVYSWTCSACATEWLERAAYMSRSDDVFSNREQVVYDIGYTGNINPTYGLMDGSGSELQRVLMDSTGLRTEQAWLSFDDAYARYAASPGLMSGAAYYHWVGVRGVQGSNLWIANSAPGYKGIWDVLSRADYERLGGFSCIWVA